LKYIARTQKSYSEDTAVVVVEVVVAVNGGIVVEVVDPKAAAV